MLAEVHACVCGNVTITQFSLKARTYFPEGAWCDDEQVDGITGHDENRRECHEPTNQLAPPRILVVHVRNPFVLHYAKYEHTLKQKHMNVLILSKTVERRL